MGQSGSRTGTQQQPRLSRREQERLAEVSRQQREMNERRSKSRAEIARLRMSIEGLEERRIAVASDIDSMSPTARFVSSRPIALSLVVPGIALAVNAVYQILRWTIYFDVVLVLIGVVFSRSWNKKSNQPNRHQNVLDYLKLVTGTALFGGIVTAIHGVAMFAIAPVHSLLAASAILFWYAAYDAKSRMGSSGTQNRCSAERQSPTTAETSSNVNRLDAKFSNVMGMLSGGFGTVAEEGELTCNICLSNRPDVAFIPCGHVRCCVACVKELCGSASAAQNQKCPECRAIIDQVFYPARGN